MADIKKAKTQTLKKGGKKPAPAHSESPKKNRWKTGGSVPVAISWMKTRFKKWESGNPKGRPRKLMNDIILAYNGKGLIRATKGEVTEILEMLLNANEQDLTEIIKDPLTPMPLRVACRRMLEKGGWELIKDILDRAQGKPVAQMEDSEGNSIPIVGLQFLVINPDNANTGTSTPTESISDLPEKLAK